ncbi:hypothetical protein FRC18_004613 [Serendipita sp. 400]|nr:hypothetical protein FRC18_004613 [Serendipita sp. 400]
MDHLASFRILSKLERITFPDLSKLDLGYDPPLYAYYGTTSLLNGLATQAEAVTNRLFGGIKKEVLTKGSPKLLSVDIGDIIFEVAVNRRLRKRRKVLREGRRQIVVEEYIDNDKYGNRK